MAASDGAPDAATTDTVAAAADSNAVACPDTAGEAAGVAGGGVVTEPAALTGPGGAAEASGAGRSAEGNPAAGGSPAAEAIPPAGVGSAAGADSVTGTDSAAGVDPEAGSAPEAGIVPEEAVPCPSRSGGTTAAGTVCSIRVGPDAACSCGSPGPVSRPQMAIPSSRTMKPAVARMMSAQAAYRMSWMIFGIRLAIRTKTSPSRTSISVRA